MSQVAVHRGAGRPAPESVRVDVPRLVTAFFTLTPDPTVPEQQVSFGTSGHRGSAEARSFNEDHVLAIVQAIADQRERFGATGPCFIGADTHALSEPALTTALSVLTANGVDAVVQAGSGATPTPAVSHAILTHNRGRDTQRADGVVLTPSHNPPSDGGIKYNPPHGGPASTDITKLIQARANALLMAHLKGVVRLPRGRAASPREHDFLAAYVGELGRVVDMDAIEASGLRLGVDPLGGAGLGYWQRIAEEYRLNLDIVNREVDPRFAFMPLDRDGKIRMDCSSRWAMSKLIELKGKYDIAFGNDPDADRHGIVTKRAGLMNPNHYLSVAVSYLFRHRVDWPASAGIGKTLVSSSMIDRVAGEVGRPLVEVPVGFKWFVPGLLRSHLAFAGEESAGAAFLRRDGSPWTTDKDGIVLSLLAAEILATTGKDPGDHYHALTERFGAPCYKRVDAPATPAQKRRLADLKPEDLSAKSLASAPITATLTRAPGNGEPIGGLKVVTAEGWFAARPSGTEDVYKIYAESFVGEAHLEQIQTEAQDIVASVIGALGA